MFCDFYDYMETRLKEYHLAAGCDDHRPALCSKRMKQSAENRRKSVTDSGYAYVTQ